MSYQTPMDICNRACDHLGIRQIQTWGENSVQYTRLSQIYDRLRRVALRSNVWTFATRRVILRPLTTTTRLFVPAAYSATTTYAAGAVVAYKDGTGPQMLWVSVVPNNLGNTPSVLGIPAAQWTPYYGPVTADAWQSSVVGQAAVGIGGAQVNTLAYNTGELVYVAPGDGNAFLYQSLQPNNGDDPWQVDLYSDSVSYSPGQLVSMTTGGPVFQSQCDLNYSNEPDIVTAAGPWASMTAYTIAQVVVGSDNIIYKAQQNSIGRNPVTDTSFTYWTPNIIDSQGNTVVMFGGTWKSVPSNTVRATSNMWLYQAGAGVAPIFLPYPIGSGPVEDTMTANAFMLPTGFIRVAPEAPHPDPVPWLGVSWSNVANDHTYENGFIISREPGPIAERFVADITDVSSMDDMFCESLAAQVALSGWELFTNKTGLKPAAQKAYDDAMKMANLQNAIEQGPIEPDLCNLIAVRI